MPKSLLLPFSPPKLVLKKCFDTASNQVFIMAWQTNLKFSRPGYAQLFPAAIKDKALHTNEFFKKIFQPTLRANG